MEQFNNLAIEQLIIPRQLSPCIPPNFALHYNYPLLLPLETRGSFSFGGLMESRSKHLLLTATLLSLVPISSTFSQDWNVQLLGDLSFPQGVWDVTVEGEYAYLAHLYEGLIIVDASNPESPVEVSRYATPDHAYGVAVSGSYAYVADYLSGLLVINISDPQNPVQAGHYQFLGAAEYVTLSGDLAYVADSFWGLRIINIADPENPFQRGFCPTPGSPGSVAVSGQFGYVADWDGGLRIIDISSPLSPFEVGHYSIPDHNAVAVAVFSNYVCVAADTGGVRFIDVTDPANPYEVGYQEMPGYAQDVFVVGTNVFVADGISGLRIINAFHPSTPIEIGYYDSPGMACGVVAFESLAYLADYTHLEIFDCSDALSVHGNPTQAVPQQFLLLPPYPNPFNATTMLAFSLLRSSQVSLIIYTLEGTKAAVVVAGQYPAGLHRIGFDVSNLSSGVYFARLLAPGFTQTQKMVVLK